MTDSDTIFARFAAVSPHIDERGKRLLAAAEAKVLGRGGVTAVSAATGMARSTINRGLKELAGGENLEPGRVRQAGGGRKPLIETDPTLVRDLLELVEPDARGDPMSPAPLDVQELAQPGA